ncbi:MAG: M3 family oligoendopeptidase [Candidatus Fermentibacteraceae bacterium]
MERISPTWDLDSIYQGGSESPRMQADLQRADQMTKKVKGLAEGGCPGAGQKYGLKRLLLDYSDALMLTEQLDSFAECLLAADTTDRRAAIPAARVAVCRGRLEAAAVRIGFRLLELADDELGELLDCSELREVAFAACEMRRSAERRMDAGREALASSLAVDGYHGWSRMYDALVGEVRVSYDSGEGVRSVSAGQAHNLMRDPSRRLRKSVFEGWKRAWGERSEAFAEVLNSLAGFRLSLYRGRGWDSPLAETLEVNRTSQKTLEAMWEAVEAAAPRLGSYLAARAGRMGLPALSWYDLEAPMSADSGKLSLQEAAEMVAGRFREFSGEMGEFARRALEEGWVESEDREGKAPGAFCTDFPIAGQSRVFTTFGGDLSSAATLAHELGHAWHGHVLRDRPYMARLYPMTLAETASTFAEALVAGAALEAAGTETDRMAVLDGLAGEAVTMLMNIRARFLFETRFYRLRAGGAPLPASGLSELMEEAQREAYCDSLAEYHPLFWCSKLHFYDTRQPFYNWPYTFGYLFSMGLRARARDAGEGFAHRWRALLADTGSGTVEELARRHLDADLTDGGFWESAVAEAVRPAEELTRLLS